MLSSYLCVWLCVHLSHPCNLVVYFHNTMVAAKETGCEREASTIQCSVTKLMKGLKKYSTFIGVIFSILFFLKEKMVGFRDHLAASVSPISTLNQLTDFHRTWYEHTTLKVTSYFFSFLQMIITTWWVCELVRWQQH